MFFWKHSERLPSRLSHRAFVVAHRGASGIAPENTIAALSQAIIQGADAIELDVRLSQDNEIVVFHDATLRRTTNGHGYVRDRTLGYLKKLDAGSWFDRSFNGERIPTLSEALELVRGRVGVNIELKPVANARVSQDLVHRCLQQIERYQASNYILLTSFQHSLLKLVRKQNPSIPVGVLYHPLHHGAQAPSRLADKVGACVFVCNIGILHQRMVANAHRHDVSVVAYTVNNERLFQRCINLGVDGIVTNVPQKILALLNKSVKS